jgi:MFS family permease
MSTDAKAHDASTERNGERAEDDSPRSRLSIGHLEWTINAYALSFAVLLMTPTALGDRFGRRRRFASGWRLGGERARFLIAARRDLTKRRCGLGHIGSPGLS